jgi:hypothetical protein
MSLLTQSYASANGGRTSSDWINGDKHGGDNCEGNGGTVSRASGSRQGSRDRDGWHGGESAWLNLATAT